LFFLAISDLLNISFKIKGQLQPIQFIWNWVSKKEFYLVSLQAAEYYTHLSRYAALSGLFSSVMKSLRFVRSTYKLQFSLFLKF